MKKQIINLSKAVRRTIVYAGFASLLAFSFVPAHAEDKKPSAAVTINYLGSVDNQPVFQIEFENKNEETYTVSIKDDQGDVLYVEKSKDKKFSKKFKYQGQGFDYVRLTFTLVSGKEKQSQEFEVNTNTRVVQDVVVTKL
jgi:hypothetical protein